MRKGAAMSDSGVRIDANNLTGVAELVLDRPAKLNAVDEAMAAAILDGLASPAVTSARAVVVRGEGKGFCAGRDLSGADPGHEDGAAILRTVFNPVMVALGSLPIPTFAAVHGPALGVGFGLAFACDVVVVADDAKLGSPFARIGAVLDSGGHHSLVTRVGLHRALELIYTGRLLSGLEAAAWGLVNRSVAPDDLLSAVRTMATQVAAGPTASFALSKAIAVAVAGGGMGAAAALEAEAVAQGLASQTADYREGMKAFQEKRPPAFIGH